MTATNSIWRNRSIRSIPIFYRFSSNSISNSISNANLNPIWGKGMCTGRHERISSNRLRWKSTARESASTFKTTSECPMTTAKINSNMKTKKETAESMIILRACLCPPHRDRRNSMLRKHFSSRERQLGKITSKNCKRNTIPTLLQPGCSNRL